MAVINLKTREVQVKIVYYGPGRGGKTTNLEYIHQKSKSRLKSDLLKIDTRGDRTLFFDFLPIEIGKIMGFNIRIQLYTVPGQQRYESTRRLVLNGVDGVVFVADSMEVCRKRNLISFEDYKKNLVLNKKTFRETPLVIQCNKIDLSMEGVSILPVRTIAGDLRIQEETPIYEGSALRGDNVIQTFKKITVLTMASIEDELKEHLKTMSAPVNAA